MKKDFLILNAKAAKLEEKYGSLENFVKQTTKAHFQHRMKMKRSFDFEVTDELLNLEKIDLQDFWHFEKENGEFG